MAKGWMDAPLAFVLKRPAPEPRAGRSRCWGRLLATGGCSRCPWADLQGSPNCGGEARHGPVRVSPGTGWPVRRRWGDRPSKGGIGSTRLAAGCQMPRQRRAEVRLTCATVC